MEQMGWLERSVCLGLRGLEVVALGSSGAWEVEAQSWKKTRTWL